MTKNDGEWIRSIRKDGKPGRWVYVEGPEYTVLETCDNCGFSSTPKKVQYRSLCDGWSRNGDWSKPGKGMLCMSCWNRVRVIVKREKECEEVKYLINKLKEVIKNERKQNNQNHGRAA